MEPMRAPTRALALAVLPLVAALALSACSQDQAKALPKPSKAFCQAAYTYDQKVERRASLTVQIALVQTMADHAPKDIAGDTQTFLTALRKRAEGDMSVVKDKKLNEEVKTAVNNVNRRAQNDCGLFEQDPPGI
jgi:signal transduction histidine kinase